MFSRPFFAIVWCSLVLGLAPLALNAELRTWVDSTGKHRVEAQFVRLQANIVTLRNQAGQEVKLPLARLSEQDQAFVRQQVAGTGSATAAGSATVKPATAKPVAKRFYFALIDQDFDALKALVSPQAETNWDSLKSQLEGLDPPDNRQAVLVRKADPVDNGVEVNVSIRVRGKYLKHLLQMRSIENQWRVIALIPEGEDTTPIHFEGGGDDRSGSDDSRLDDDSDEEEDESEAEELDEESQAEPDGREPTADGSGAFETSDQVRALLTVPDGDVEQLLRFVESLKSVKAPAGAARDELMEFQVQLLTAVVEATGKILQREPTEAQAATAMRARVQVLTLLDQLRNAPEITNMLESLPDELRRLGYEQLARNAKSLQLNHALTQVRNASQAKDVIKRGRSHLREFAKLGADEFKLARGLGQLAERIEPTYAADVYNEVAALLEKDTATQPYAESMRGTARRLGLVGNSMALTGITLQDQQFDLNQLDGKIVLVDFWATWCGPCLQEMPNIRRNYEKYHSLGFEVVAVSVDQDLTALKKFVDQESPPWIVLVDEHPQNPHKMGEYYGVSAIPTTVLVGADGKVITFDCRGDQLGAQLERLLGQGDAS